MCYIDNLTQIIEYRNLEVRYICFEIKYKYKVDSNSINYISNWFCSSVEMKTQKATVTNCHYNQIGFSWLDNVNINFVNNSSQHEN
jgi:hypothetical protein